MQHKNAPPALTKVLCSSSASAWSAWHGRTLEADHLLSRKHRGWIFRSPCNCICLVCTPTPHTCTEPQTTARLVPKHPAAKTIVQQEKGVKHQPTVVSAFWTRRPAFCTACRKRWQQCVILDFKNEKTALFSSRPTHLGRPRRTHNDGRH